MEKEWTREKRHKRNRKLRKRKKENKSISLDKSKSIRPPIHWLKEKCDKEFNNLFIEKEGGDVRENLKKERDREKESKSKALDESKSIENHLSIVWCCRLRRERERKRFKTEFKKREG